MIFSSVIAGLFVCPADIDDIITSSNFLTQVGLSPRERLLLAIEQQCSLEHLNHLVQWHSLDVRAGGNALLIKAAGCSNGKAFMWLVSLPSFALADLLVSSSCIEAQSTSRIHLSVQT